MTEHEAMTRCEALLAEHERRWPNAKRLVCCMSFWPTVWDIVEMLERALRRGSPLREKDFPPVPTDRVY